MLADKRSKGVLNFLPEVMLVNGGPDALELDVGFFHNYRGRSRTYEVAGSKPGYNADIVTL